MLISQLKVNLQLWLTSFSFAGEKKKDVEDGCNYCVLFCLLSIYEYAHLILEYLKKVDVWNYFIEIEV